eukprot:366465-Chlamydomonas_euryale.AAC.9
MDNQDMLINESHQPAMDTVAGICSEQPQWLHQLTAAFSEQPQWLNQLTADWQNSLSTHRQGALGCL